MADLPLIENANIPQLPKNHQDSNTHGNSISEKKALPPSHGITSQYLVNEQRQIRIADLAIDNAYVLLPPIAHPSSSCQRSSNGNKSKADTIADSHVSKRITTPKTAHEGMQFNVM